MIKEDLLNIVSGVENGTDINELVLGQDEFKNIFKFDATKLTLQDYKDLLEANEIIKGYQTSLLDSAVSKGVESFKEKSMPKYIDEALKKASNKSKTPEQLAFEEMKSKYEELEKQIKLKDLESKYTKILSDKKIPIDAMSLILGQNDDEIENKIGLLEKIITPLVDERVKEKLGASSYTPPNGNSSIGVSNPWAKETFNLTKQGDILRKDPGLAKQLMQVANNK